MKSYSTSAIIAFSILFLTLGFTTAGIIWQFEQADYGNRWFNPDYGIYLKEASSIFFDDLIVTIDEHVVFSEDFDHCNISNSNWYIPTGTEGQVFQQMNYTHSPPNAIAFRHSGPIAGTASHKIKVVRDWETVNYTAWVMVPDFFDIWKAKEAYPLRDYNDTFTGLTIYSKEDESSLSGKIVVNYLADNDMFKTHLYIGAIYRTKINETLIDCDYYQTLEHYNFSLTPYQWYKMSLILDRKNEELHLCFDDVSILQLSLDVSYFEEIDNIGIWGWTP